MGNWLPADSVFHTEYGSADGKMVVCAYSSVRDFLFLFKLVVAYQLEMMKNLRHVNIDHLHVGWYQSTNFGTYVNKALVDSQFNYQFSIDESIVLIYGKYYLTALSFSLHL